MYRKILNGFKSAANLQAGPTSSSSALESSSQAECCCGGHRCNQRNSNTRKRLRECRSLPPTFSPFGEPPIVTISAPSRERDEESIDLSQPIITETLSICSPHFKNRSQSLLFPRGKTGRRNSKRKGSRNKSRNASSGSIETLKKKEILRSGFWELADKSPLRRTSSQYTSGQPVQQSINVSIDAVLSAPNLASRTSRKSSLASPRSRKKAPASSPLPARHDRVYPNPNVVIDLPGSRTNLFQVHNHSGEENYQGEFTQPLPSPSAPSVVLPSYSSSDNSSGLQLNAARLENSFVPPLSLYRYLRPEDLEEFTCPDSCSAEANQGPSNLHYTDHYGLGRSPVSPIPPPFPLITTIPTEDPSSSSISLISSDHIASLGSEKQQNSMTGKSIGQNGKAVLRHQSHSMASTDSRVSLTVKGLPGPPVMGPNVASTRWGGLAKAAKSFQVRSRKWPICLIPHTSLYL